METGFEVELETLESMGMKIAIFGRTMHAGSLRELSAFVQELKGVNSLEVLVYEPFKRYILNLLADGRQNGDCVCEGGESIKQLRGFFEEAGEFLSHKELSQNIDFFFSLGGDGTFLSSVPFLRDSSIPVVGLNFGRLGFLTSSKIGDNGTTNKWLENLLSGKYTTAPRPLLELESEELPQDFYPFALNEFAIQREGPAVLELNIKINGQQVPGYVADGVLISTPTGSTAYSLSAGGPIVLPECNVLNLVPIAPHNLNIRPLVLPSTSVVEISFSTRYNCARVTADNRSFKVSPGKTIKIKQSSTALTVVTPDIDFMSALNKKLYWGADWRNL